MRCRAHAGVTAAQLQMKSQRCCSSHHKVHISRPGVINMSRLQIEHCSRDRCCTPNPFRLAVDSQSLISPTVPAALEDVTLQPADCQLLSWADAADAALHAGLHHAPRPWQLHAVPSATPPPAAAGCCGHALNEVGCGLKGAGCHPITDHCHK